MNIKILAIIAAAGIGLYVIFSILNKTTPAINPATGLPYPQASINPLTGKPYQTTLGTIPAAQGTSLLASIAALFGGGTNAPGATGGTASGGSNLTAPAPPNAVTYGPTLAQLNGIPASPSPVIENDSTLPLTPASPSIIQSLNGDPAVSDIADTADGLDYPGIQAYMVDPSNPDFESGDAFYS